LENRKWLSGPFKPGACWLPQRCVLLPDWRQYRNKPCDQCCSMEYFLQMWTRFVAAFRSALLWLLNFIIALFGPAILGTPLSRFFHPHTIEQVIIRTYLLSAVIAFCLGFFIYRQWRPAVAKWVGVGGICWFCFGAIVNAARSNLWYQMSGAACEYGLEAIGCRTGSSLLCPL
jgi:hypothetical protein